MGKVKVLYVDDEDDIREIAQMSLELNPEFEIRPCASGRDALAQAAEWKPDMILLDVMMPDMDGPETLECLKADAALNAIPVVFITARTQTHEVKKFLSLGAVGVIGKPFDPMTLADEVSAMFKKLNAK